MAREASSERTYGNDTSHDDWNDTLHHQVWPEHRHGGDADTRLGRSITVESVFVSFEARRDVPPQKPYLAPIAVDNLLDVLAET